MPTANQIALTNAVAASHAAAIRWLDGPDRDPMIARILAYWPPTDRYWPCHGHMDGGHSCIPAAEWGQWESWFTGEWTTPTRFPTLRTG